MKKGLVIFAAASMMAAGVSLAANVSFGQKMASMLANAFEFVGPVSGLVHALVKPKDESKAPVIPSFQDELSTPKPGAVILTPSKGSRLPLDPHTHVASVAAEAPQASPRAISDDVYTPGVAASALAASSIPLAGSVARTIVDSGEGAALANLGRDLKSRQPEFAAGLSQDVWAHLINKPALGGAPIKLAMNTSISNKQIEASAALIYAQSASVAPTSENSSPVATQITSAALIRTGSPVPASGQVPVPGALGLLVAGLLMLGARSRFKNQEGLH